MLQFSCLLHAVFSSINPTAKQGLHSKHIPLGQSHFTSYTHKRQHTNKFILEHLPITPLSQNEHSIVELLYKPSVPIRKKENSWTFLYINSTRFVDSIVSFHFFHSAIPGQVNLFSLSVSLSLSLFSPLLHYPTQI